MKAVEQALRRALNACDCKFNCISDSLVLLG